MHKISQSKVWWRKLPDVFLHGIIFDRSVPKWPFLQSTIRATATTVPRRATPSNMPAIAPATLSEEEALRVPSPACGRDKYAAEAHAAHNTLWWCDPWSILPHLAFQCQL